jgi:hypothetical protein
MVAVTCGDLAARQLQVLATLSTVDTKEVWLAGPHLRRRTPTEAAAAWRWDREQNRLVG